jgi:hypothetical protein
MDSVSRSRPGANPATAATPKVTRRVQGRHSLSTNTNRHSPVFGPDSTPVFGDELSASRQARRGSLTTDFSESTTTTKSPSQHPDRQIQKRKVLSKRQQSGPSKGSGPSEVSSYLSRIKSHLQYHRRASESATARPVIGKPFEPVHRNEGPEGEDIKMIRNAVFVGPAEKAHLASQDRPLRSFASHEKIREQALKAHTSAVEPRNSKDLSPYVPSQVPLIIIDTALDVNQYVPNAPWGSRKLSNHGPNLTVSDGWQRGKNYKHARLPTPLPVEKEAHSSQPLATHLHQLHASNAALESVAIQRQTEANFSAAVARHYKFLDHVEELRLRREQDRARESLVSTGVGDEIAELYAGFPFPVAGPEVPENVLDATPIIVEVPAPNPCFLPSYQPFQSYAGSQPHQDDRLVHELPAKASHRPLRSLPVELAVSETRTFEPGASAPVLPELEQLGTGFGGAGLFLDGLLGEIPGPDV